MPQYRAVRAFGIEGKGKFGHVRQGMVVTMSEKEAGDFNRPHPKGSPILVPYTGPAMQEPLQPGSTGGIPGAPFHSEDDHDDGHGEDDPHADRDDGRDETDDETQDDEDLDDEDGEGNEETPPDGDEQTPDRAARRGGGRGKQSSASRRGRASRRKT